MANTISSCLCFTKWPEIKFDWLVDSDSICAVYYSTVTDWTILWGCTYINTVKTLLSMLHQCPGSRSSFFLVSGTGLCVFCFQLHCNIICFLLT